MDNFIIPSETLEKIASPEAEALAFLSDAAQISSAIRASGLFDRALYLDSNPDVKAAGIDPVDHYVNYGCREGRNPNTWFDTGFYLNDNPDIAGKLANPFLHYIYAGYREGRRPNPAIQRTRSRLIAVIMGEKSAPINIVSTIRNLHKAETPPDEIIVAIERPLDMDIFAYGPLFNLLENASQLRLYDKGGVSRLFGAILDDYGSDAIYFLGALAAKSGEVLTRLITSQAKMPGMIHATSLQRYLNDGVWRKDDHREGESQGAILVVPRLAAGLVLPSGMGKEILKMAPGLPRKAIESPEIWLAVTNAIKENALMAPLEGNNDKEAFIGTQEEMAEFGRRILGEIRAVYPDGNTEK